MNGGVQFFKVHNSTLSERSSAVVRAHCCEDCCLLSTFSYQKGKDVVSKIMRDRENMNRTENKNDLREKILVRCLIILNCYMLWCSN